MKSSQMDSIVLCDFCNKINFDALRTPLTSDLPALREGRVDRSRYPFKSKRDDAHSSVPLGTFNDILQRALTCRLCELIASALKRYNSHRGSGPRLEGNDGCRATASFYGIYRDPQGDTHYPIQRLSIFIDGDWWRSCGLGICCAFQACNAGAVHVQVDETFIDPRSEVDSMIFGGRQRPLLLDLKWIRQWIEICQTKHSEACARPEVDPSGQKLPYIRFIDVDLRRIVTLSETECKYIALSYVWGGPQRVVLDSSNIKNLEQEGSLAEKSLPRTIEDSILLTKTLGVKYLWVDALCIIQDDKEDKKVQITAMDQIYNSAFLTIVAASAPNADGGLPGLRPGTRSFQQQEVLVRPGLSLMATVQLLNNHGDHYLEHTPWNSRGWTMQERALSRRALVFTAEQVYWACREATFFEESYFEDSLLRFLRFHESAQELTVRRTFRAFSQPDDDALRFWKAYQTLVAGYTRRTFTQQGDIFDGFLAVLQGVSGISGERFLWALPRSHFEQGLMWNTFTGQRRRKELSTLPMTSKNVEVPFPSWSWMGWIGEASVCIDDERYDEAVGEVPDILCYEHKHAPLRVEPVRQVSAPYQQGPAEWKHRLEQTVTLKDLERVHPRLLAELGDIPEEQLIFFWTSSAMFNLTPVADKAGGRKASVLDSEGTVVGEMGVMDLGYMEEGGFDRGRHEMVVIGSRRNAFSDPTLLVLQIRWQGGTAYRVNCGDIEEKAWIGERSTWKLIPLR